MGSGFGCKVDSQRGQGTYRRDGINAVVHPRPNNPPRPAISTSFFATASVHGCRSHPVCALQRDDEDTHLRLRSKLVTMR